MATGSFMYDRSDSAARYMDRKQINELFEVKTGSVETLHKLSPSLIGSDDCPDGS